MRGFLDGRYPLYVVRSCVLNRPDSEYSSSSLTNLANLKHLLSSWPNSIVIVSLTLSPKMISSGDLFCHTPHCDTSESSLFCPKCGPSRTWKKFDCFVRSDTISRVFYFVGQNNRIFSARSHPSVSASKHVLRLGHHVVG